jgi:hypothetical protein
MPETVAVYVLSLGSLGIATTNELFSIYVVMPKEHRKAKSL